MRNSFAVVLLSCCTALLFVCACSTAQHTNTLVFGTNTKLAVDISASSPPTPPGISVGYTRQEFVWMPLAINNYRTDDQGRARLEPCVQTSTTNCFYRGNESTSDKDAYSVLASFGSKTSGTDGVSIAQYFATGLAARKLAGHPNSYKLFSVQPEAPIKYGIDDNTKKIRDWLKKDDAKNREALGKWLEGKGYSKDDIPYVLNAKEYSDLRSEAVKELNIN